MAQVQTHVQIQAPATFNFERAEEWPRWIKRFERYITASGLNSKDGETQVNTFTVVIRYKLRRQFKIFDHCIIVLSSDIFQFSNKKLLKMIDNNTYYYISVKRNIRILQLSNI